MTSGCQFVSLVIVLQVYPTRTEYTFNGNGVTMLVDFVTPTIINSTDYVSMSRPVTFINIKVWRRSHFVE